MNKFIEVNTGIGTAWLREDAITAIDIFKNGNDAFIRCGGDVRVDPDEARRIAKLMNGEGESISTDELTLDNIVSIERTETSNSNSPMWRCTTANGHKVNIFKHADKDKDNFHLFEAKGWADVLLAMPMYEQIDTTDSPVAIAMKKDGKWWAIVTVMQAPSEVAEFFGSKASNDGEGDDDDYDYFEYDEVMKSECHIFDLKAASYVPDHESNLDDYEVPPQADYDPDEDDE